MIELDDGRGTDDLEDWNGNAGSARAERYSSGGARSDARVRGSRDQLNSCSKSDRELIDGLKY